MLRTVGRQAHGRAGKLARRMKKPTKKRPGRPPQNIIRLPAASVEEVADRIFANAKPPDPSLRIRNRPKG